MLGELGRLLRAIANGPDPAKLPPAAEVIFTAELLEEPSFAWMRNCFLYGGYAIEGAGVARSHVGLWNPSGSGVVAVITEFHSFSSAEQMLLTIGTNANALTMDSDGAEHPRDTRGRVSTAVTRNPSCAVVSDDAAQIGTIVERIYMRSTDGAGNYQFHERIPFVLFPGAVFNILPDNNAKTNYTSFNWYERRYDPAEVQGVNQAF